LRFSPPRRGSISVIASIWSPHHSNPHRGVGLVRREDLDGIAATRNVPRWKSTSLRSYCSSTSRRSTLSRSTLVPTSSSHVIAP